MPRRIELFVGLAIIVVARLSVAPSTALCDNIPSASGDTPYSLVSAEEPVKPSQDGITKPVSAASEVHVVKPSEKYTPSSLEKDDKDSFSGRGFSKEPAPKEAPSQETPTPSADAKVTQSEPAVGEPLAPGIIQVLQAEILAAFRERGNVSNFAKFQRYAAFKLDSSAAPYTGSELAGNCRLSWYDHLLRHPLSATGEAEQFTRDVHTAISNDRGGLARLLPIIAAKLDCPKHEVHPYPVAKSPQEALEIVKRALIEAQVAHAAALAPLSKSEVRELAAYIYPIMLGQNKAAHTLSDRGTGRRLVDLMEKMDRSALISAAEALVPLTDPELLDQLKAYPDNTSVTVDGVSGHVVAKIATPAGAIVIGGKESNVYHLEAMRDVACVIDLGDENGYSEGAVNIDRPLLVTLNLGGKNVFRGSKPGIQGSSILGVSMIVNCGGGNRYIGEDVAQASTIGGVAIIDEFGGHNDYKGVRRVQAQAIGGIGILIGRGGENNYHAAMWAQGLGGPLGFGILDDLQGHDHYYVGGLNVNSYKPETPGYEGFGQGVGGGIRQVADGGIGMLLNGGGHNVYEFDYLSHGGGYWCGLGFARDFGGYSKRLIARKNFYGGERTEELFQRFGCGWGCHYALGFCFDDKGHSTFEGSIMGSGMAWDCSVGALCVLGGDNKFEAANSLVQGCGAQGSLGILYVYGDNSVFKGYGQGYSASTLTYHDPLQCGGNFSFLVNYGAGNKYGCGAQEHSIVQRGTPGGFFISRPRHDQPTPTAARPPTKATAGP